MKTHAPHKPKAHTMVWAFSVTPQHQAAFEAAYRPNGDWTVLFSRHAGYQYTRLYRDTSSRPDGLLHYLCEDLWQSEADFDEFKGQHDNDYQALDARCDAWTVAEQQLR